MSESGMPAMRKTPFQKDNQLSSSLDGVLPILPSTPDSMLPHKPGTNLTTLPDFPNVSLHDTSGLIEFLKDDLHSSDLESMAPHLWMLSTQSSQNVGPLTHQRVKGRQIIITEDPKLHLVWVSDRIFIKPLPTYLLNHDFWAHVLAADELEGVRRSALGFLRTYALLIRHPSDFRMAKELFLIPVDASMTLEKFSRFKADLETIVDEDVSGRYHFGELRLTRLNFYIKFVLRKWWFQKVQTTSGDYFGRFYGPLLFVFTSLSLILSALQAEMAVEQVLAQSGSAGWPKGTWSGLVMLTRWVAVLSFVVISLLSILIAGLLISLHVREWNYALRDKFRKGRKLRSEQSQMKRGR